VNKVPNPMVKLRGATYVAAAVILGVLGAACGGGSSSSSSNVNAAGVSEAKTLVAKQKAPVSFPNLPSFDASKARGKSVWFISNLGSNSFTTDLYNPFKKALNQFGVDVHFFDGQGQASVEARGIEEAVAAHTNEIFIQDFAVSTVQGAVNDAHAAKIPVVEWANQDAGQPPAPGNAAETTYCYTCAGKYIADDVIATSNGNVNAVIITSSDVPPSEFEINGILGEFQRLCPSTCHARKEDVLIADWSTKLPVMGRTISADQSVNWIIPMYDPETTFLDPGIIQAGAASRVKVCSYNATVGAVVQLKQSGNPLYCDIGSSLAWSGYANADMVLRVLAGVPPVKDEQIPLRTFDRTNVADIDFSAQESTWYGGVDFIKEYNKIWGLSS
jgi:ribose transport system substrate-binding protein